jgi:hypothetical protein
MTSEAWNALREEIGGELAHPELLPAAQAAAEAIRADFGPAVEAVLFYGSGLRDGDDSGKVLDFYVIVRRYREAYPSLAKALANAVLPPNVFYFETAFEGRAVRSKVAVYSMADFAEAASRGHFDSYVWSRFAQPSALVYARNDDAALAIAEAVSHAVVTLLEKTVPLVPPAFSSDQLWTRAFTETYSVELRSERPGKGAEIYAANAARYDRLAKSALSLTKWNVTSGPDGFVVANTSARRFRALVVWRTRRIYCSTLHVLRLIKAVFTFAGGIDYLAWKISRHSGVAIEITPWQRRHPLLAGLTLFWRLRRRGAFR